MGEWIGCSFDINERHAPLIAEAIEAVGFDEAIDGWHYGHFNYGGVPEELHDACVAAGVPYDWTISSYWEYGAQMNVYRPGGVRAEFDGDGYDDFLPVSPPELRRCAEKYPGISLESAIRLIESDRILPLECCPSLGELAATLGVTA